MQSGHFVQTFESLAVATADIIEAKVGDFDFDGLITLLAKLPPRLLEEKAKGDPDEDVDTLKVTLTLTKPDAAQFDALERWMSHCLSSSGRRRYARQHYVVIVDWTQYTQSSLSMTASAVSKNEDEAQPPKDILLDSGKDGEAIYEAMYQASKSHAKKMQREGKEAREMQQ